jgi:hypothetical protein
MANANQKLQEVQAQLLVEIDGKLGTFSDKIAAVVLMLQKPSMYQPRDAEGILASLQAEIAASKSLLSLASLITKK